MFTTEEHDRLAAEDAAASAAMQAMDETVRTFPTAAARERGERDEALGLIQEILDTTDDYRTADAQTILRALEDGGFSLVRKPW